MKKRRSLSIAINAWCFVAICLVIITLIKSDGLLMPNGVPKVCINDISENQTLFAQHYANYAWGNWEYACIINKKGQAKFVMLHKDAGAIPPEGKIPYDEKEFLAYC